ncbi:MAG: hypothetical protein QNJ81_07210 [Acidimicrobiia bacterium]|nr:hypothetical protein [Acidimicrobiia bacterium]
MAFGDERYGRKHEEWVRIDVEEVLDDDDSRSAILVSTCEISEGVWIPRSLMRNEERNKQDELVSVEIPEWVAVERGLV